MQAESVVLVGVVNRKRDLIALRDEHWYRIPQGKAPRGIDADIFAFFLSGKVFQEKSGGIHYYAHRRGIELATRRDLLPDEADHKRAAEVYHKIQLAPLIVKTPPIINQPNPYRFSFIYTTWDRFQAARHVRDLYSTADYFVDRVFHALRQRGLKPQRTWESARQTLVYPQGAQLRVICENGTVVASTSPQNTEDNQEVLYIQPQKTVSTTVATIQQAVADLGGPMMVDLPVELY